MRIMLLVALAAAASVAQAQDGAPRTDKAEKPICKRMAVPGSRLGGAKSCHTKAEWAAIGEADAAQVRDARGAASQR